MTSLDLVLIALDYVMLIPTAVSNCLVIKMMRHHFNLMLGLSSK